MRRPNQWTIIVFVLVTLVSAARQVNGQHVSGGVMHGKFAAKAPVQLAVGSFAIPFATTAVGATASEDCYYNCFFISGGSCNFSGIIELKQQASPPFRGVNYRKTVAGTSCGGSPVTFPVTLQPNEVLLQDFQFSPTSPGSFKGQQVYLMTPSNSPADDFSWLFTGSTPPAAPVIDSFTATPTTIRPGQSSTLAWSVSGASSVLIDNGVGSQATSGAVSTSRVYTLIAFA